MARQGQVRCGICHRIFNAVENLSARLAKATAGFVPASAPTQHLDADSAAWRAQWGARWPAWDPSETGSAESPGQSHNPETRWSVPAPSGTGLGESPGQSGSPGAYASIPAASDFAAFGTAGRTADWGSDASAAQESLRYRPWLRPVSAAVLCGVLVLLTLLTFRAPLAREHPALKPFLEAACAVFRCEIALPKDADQLSIEASELRADPARPNSIIVNATVRNRARFAQAYPALELTLTDAQNQTVARRVLQPRDYLDKTANLKKGIAPNSEVTVKFNEAADGNAALGYRLILFYP
jgi:hypothetical protein